MHCLHSHVQTHDYYTHTSTLTAHRRAHHPLLPLLEKGATEVACMIGYYRLGHMKLYYNKRQQTRSQLYRHTYINIFPASSICPCVGYLIVKYFVVLLSIETKRLYHLPTQP